MHTSMFVCVTSACTHIHVYNAVRHVCGAAYGPGPHVCAKGLPHHSSGVLLPPLTDVAGIWVAIALGSVLPVSALLSLAF